MKSSLLIIKLKRKGIKKEKQVMLFININLKNLNITLAKKILHCIHSDQVELIVAVPG